MTPDFLKFLRESLWRRGASWRGCHIANRHSRPQDSAPPAHYIHWGADRAAGKDIWEDPLPWCVHTGKACTGCWSFWGKNSGSIAVNAGKGAFLPFNEQGLSITVQEKLWLMNFQMAVKKRSLIATNSNLFLCILIMMQQSLNELKFSSCWFLQWMGLQVQQ